MTPSRMIIAPLLVLFLGFLYLTYRADEQYAFGMIGCAVLVAAVFSLAPQVDWRWYVRNPPDLTPPLRDILERFHPFYRRLGEGEKRRFRQRCALYVIATDFMPITADADPVPEDLRVVMASNAVEMLFGREELLLEKYDKVVLYPQPFPSPQFPLYFHSAEIFEEDGVILLAAAPLMQGTFQPEVFLNVGMYAVGQAFVSQFKEQKYPDMTTANAIECLVKISGFSVEKIKETVGLPEIDWQAMGIAFFILFSHRFSEILPDEARALQEILYPTTSPMQPYLNPHLQNSEN